MLPVGFATYLAGILDAEDNQHESCRVKVLILVHRSDSGIQTEYLALVDCW